MNATAKYFLATLIAAALIGGSYYIAQNKKKAAAENAQFENYVKTVGAADTYTKAKLQECLNEQERKRREIYASGEAKTLEQQKLLFEIAEKRYAEDKDTCFRLYGEN